MDVYEYYNKLNPEFLLDIAKEYLAQVGPSPIRTTLSMSLWCRGSYPVHTAGVLHPYPVFMGGLCDAATFPKEGCRLPRTW